MRSRWACMFVDSFNSGKVPVLKDAVSLAKEVRMRDLADKAVESWVQVVSVRHAFDPTRP